MNKIIIASGPVIVDAGKVLLDQHGDDSFWKFCGGMSKGLSEDLLSVARRKAEEEIGVEFELLSDEPFLFYSLQEIAGERVEVILVHWLAKTKGEIKKGQNVRELAWHDLKNLPDDLAPNIIPALSHFHLLG